MRASSSTLFKLSMNIRAFFFGLVTVSGLARKGFFVPYRYAGRIPLPGENTSYVALMDTFAARERVFEKVLVLVDSYADDLLRIDSEPPPAPRWKQDWYPRLDAATLYSFVRSHLPKRIIEVGSGHSTRFIARAIFDGKIPCAVTAIDPAPRATLRGLNIDFIESTVQQVRTAPFEMLEPGDFLVIDSSHVLMPGSDVDFILNRVLPMLPAGVWVRFHDIFLLEDYPVEWGWRGYNEQNAVAQLTLSGFETEFSSRYAVTRMRPLLEKTILGRLPIQPGAYETSLWLRKVS